MISNELKMRIKSAIRAYKECEEESYSVMEMNEAAEEMCSCLINVLRENTEEMINNVAR